MNKEEKYQGKDISELGKLFFEIGNTQLVPAFKEHFMKGLEIYKNLQLEDEELTDMIIVADFDENIFAFAKGTGEELESKDDESVFYIAQDDRFVECMELLNYIAFGNHPEGYLNFSQETMHWIGDAIGGMEDAPELQDVNLSVYSNYYYGESEDDPLLEVFNR